MGINFPAKYGGQEADTMTCAYLIKELSKLCSGVAGSVTTAGMTSAYLILAAGSEEQKETYLYGVPKGETIVAFGATEPDAGSDLSGLQTYAVKEGDYYRINGTKTFCSNASVADIFLIVANTGIDKREFTVFLIEGGTEGLSVSEAFNKLGWSSQDTAEVSLSDVMVPEKNIVGGLGKGLASAFTSINFTRIMMGATAWGVAEAALENTIEYVNQKSRCGKILSENQGIRSVLANMAVEIESAGLLVYQAAVMQDRQVRNRKEAAMAKYYATNIAKRVSKETLRIHGIDGFSHSHQAAIFFCDTPVFTIADGTSEIQLENIAKELKLLKSGQMGIP